MLTLNELIKKLEDIKAKDPSFGEFPVVLEDSEYDYCSSYKISTKNLVKDGDDFYNKFVVKGEIIVPVICLEY